MQMESIYAPLPFPHTDKNLLYQLRLMCCVIIIYHARQHSLVQKYHEKKDIDGYYALFRSSIDNRDILVITRGFQL